MDNDNVSGQNSLRPRLNQEERRRSFERTTEAAKEYIDAERRKREAKTERLRIARLQAEDQGRQL